MKEYVRLDPKHGGFGTIESSKVVYPALGHYFEVDVAQLERVAPEVVYQEYNRVPYTGDEWIKSKSRTKFRFKAPGQQYALGCAAFDLGLRLVPDRDGTLGPGTWMPTADGVVFGCPHCGVRVNTGPRRDPWRVESLRCVAVDRFGRTLKGCSRHLFVAVQGVYEEVSPFEVKTSAKNKRRRKSQRP